MRCIGLTFRAALLSLCLAAPAAAGDDAPGSSRPEGPAQPYLLAQAQPSPFEDIPLEETGAPSPFEDVQEAEEERPSPQRSPDEIVEAVEFRGTRRIPRDNLSARIFTKRGDLLGA